MELTETKGKKTYADYQKHNGAGELLYPDFCLDAEELFASPSFE